MKGAVWIVSFLFCWQFASAQHFSFTDLFNQHHESFDSIITQKNKYRIQILYTRIDRDENNEASFQTYTFDADKYYYYCASTIKLPAAVFCLEKLNELAQYGISRYDSVAVENKVCKGMTAENLYQNKAGLSIDLLIKNMLVVSDNNAYNPIFDFVSPDRLNQRLFELHFKDAVFCKRFAACDAIENRWTNPITFFTADREIRLIQESIQSEESYKYRGRLQPYVGKAFLKNGLVNKPFDFSEYNYIKLSDLNQLNQLLFFPKKDKLSLSNEDYKTIKKYMGMYPRESTNPIFDTLQYPDNLMKYFWKLDSGNYRMPDHIRFFNKVGQAYGFLTDCSYFQDSKNGIEFFLTASIYVNKNETLNDGKYEYETTGFPFLQNLFRAIYQEELRRTKKCLPNFETIRFQD